MLSIFFGWHDHERVFDHALKTADRAKQEVGGEFITNEKARKLFLEWMDEDIFGMKRRDVCVLTALVHDCGKVLQYREGDTINSLATTFLQTEQTSFPGHEYWGGELVVPEILKDISLHVSLKEHIATLVKVHDTFNIYFFGKQDWSLAKLIEDAKSRAEGYYKEAMFNSYCDCYTASAFASAKARIEEVFNKPDLYTKRTYFTP